MDQEQSELRQIEDSRTRVAGDVRSVAGSINVVQRTKEAVMDRVDRAKEAVQGTVEHVPSAIKHMKPLENPVAMLLGGVATGFLAGLAIPKRRHDR